MLAQLSRQPPDQSMLDRMIRFVDIEPNRDEMALAMSMLGLSATHSMPQSLVGWRTFSPI
jgi:hypothetical protein